VASTFLHNYVMDACRKAVGNMPDFWVMTNSLGWLEKGVLTESDLMEIQALIDAKNAPVEEPVEEPLEEAEENE